MIALIDYDAGNIQSVMNALNRLDADYQLTDDPQTIQQADKVIFPGVGHAGAAMAALKRKKLDHVIKGLSQPVLGICVGMQLMCDECEEGSTKGMGIIPADVVRFSFNKLKIPHMGWNEVNKTTDCSLFDAIDNNEHFYFVHSYHVPMNKFSVATCTYQNRQESLIFSAAVQKDNFYGIQFHAEKSGIEGSNLLKNFIERT